MLGGSCKEPELALKSAGCTLRLSTPVTGDQCGSSLPITGVCRSGLQEPARKPRAGAGCWEKTWQILLSLLTSL